MGMSYKNISAIELKRLSKICERVHYSNSNEPFANHLYVVLKDVLPSIHFASIQFSLSPLGLTRAINETLPDFNGFMRYMHQHPGVRCYLEFDRPVGSLLTELGPEAYRKTELYNEVYRPADIEDQVWVGVGDREELLAISYSRDQAYAEQDQLLLSMIQPHANIAWKNWKRLRNLEEKLRTLSSMRADTELQEQSNAAMQTSIQSLTRRQRQVVELVASGKTNVEIAADLHISPRTVGKHLEQIFTAVDVTNRTALARMARRGA
jgi:DNA-binding CsgD family transcriptional regulator